LSIVIRSGVVFLWAAVPEYERAELTLGVKSLDDTTSAVKAAGGSIVREKESIPGIGYIVLAGDTEGNVFGLMEADPGAK
jgi:uncharacterized protein